MECVDVSHSPVHCAAPGFGKDGMKRVFDDRLDAIQQNIKSPFRGASRGVEKEALRITRDGRLARTPHPEALGSALTNDYITTDFSEALLEFVTHVCPSIDDVRREIEDVHQFACAVLDDEMLWSASMPCILADDSQIPLARYGSSNVGRMKTVYRRGLGYRYGRAMQTIAGVHYNYSLPDDFWPAYRDILGTDDADVRSIHYLGLVRNFRRFGWVVPYLFGASPALCRSFAGDRVLDMPLMGGSYYQPYATSLRMSDLGYSNKNQSRIRISLNSLDEYIEGLTRAIHTPEPAYEKIGVKVDGKYRQLSANQLQIENEYYSPIRPKRVARSGERPTAALRRGGIEYIEVRSLDCNLFEPAGLCPDTMHFVEAFLIYCLLEASPPLADDELAETAANQALIAKDGRNPECVLSRQGTPLGAHVWARQIVDDVAAIAELMDDSPSTAYRDAVARVAARVDDLDLTPSARILREMREAGTDFFDLALDYSQRQMAYFARRAPLPEARLEQFVTEARASHVRQAEVEASDVVSFDAYLESFFAAD